MWKLMDIVCYFVKKILTIYAVTESLFLPDIQIARCNIKKKPYEAQK